MSQCRPISTTCTGRLDANTANDLVNSKETSIVKSSTRNNQVKHPKGKSQQPPKSLVSQTSKAFRRFVPKHDNFEEVRPQNVEKEPLQKVFRHPSAAIILRDACKCAKCKDESTQQRNFNVAHIPLDITPSEVQQDTQGNWRISWTNDIPGFEDHTSTFATHDLNRLTKSMNNGHVTSVTLWNKTRIGNEKFTVNYQDYMKSESVLCETLFNFARYGLVFIKNVPEDTKSVKQIAERIGQPKSTFYGETWNVQSVPEAKNVAYTNKYLGFHSDLLYIKESPSVQFLHCLRNSAIGGESLFVDQFEAYDLLCQEDQESAAELARTWLRYEYENDGHYYSDVKPVVERKSMRSFQFPSRRIRNHRSIQTAKIGRMFWSPPFLGSILGVISGQSNYLPKKLAAMKKYAAILERDELIHREKLTPGTCVMFDNLRVLHARNAFDSSSGERWLRGTYLDGQELWSKEIYFQTAFEKLETTTT